MDYGLKRREMEGTSELPRCEIISVSGRGWEWEDRWIVCGLIRCDGKFIGSTLVTACLEKIIH